MATFVRVRLENGSEASVSDEFAKLHKLDPLTERGGELKPAERSGRALPAKHRTSKGSTARSTADTPKEK